MNQEEKPSLGGIFAGIAVIVICFFGGIYMFISSENRDIGTIFFWMLGMPMIGFLVGIGLMMRSMPTSPGCDPFDTTTRGTRESREKSYVHEPPQFCQNCGGNISAEQVDWIGPLTIRCPYCGKSLATVKREV